MATVRTVVAAKGLIITNNISVDFAAKTLVVNSSIRSTSNSDVRIKSPVAVLYSGSKVIAASKPNGESILIPANRTVTSTLRIPLELGPIALSAPELAFALGSGQEVTLDMVTSTGIFTALGVQNADQKDQVKFRIPR